ncbi:MAG: 2-dehydropantoate 2-reductase [Anaerolineales bacterium]|nr:2-dehydropantoate 2-reductase [Anaerolineales bacterium]
MASELKFLIFGAGAIGTYIGGSLVLTGQAVTFVEREKNIEELKSRGLRLDLTLDESVVLSLSKGRNTKESFVIEPRTFTFESSLESALKFGPFDVAIVALKSYDMPALLETMKPFAEKLPPILCLSNGVDNEPLIAEIFGKDKVIYGTVTTAVKKRNAGDIVLEKLRGVGVAKGHPLSETLFEIFNQAFLKCRLYPHAESMKWSKLFTNLVANASSAILNMNARQVLSNTYSYKLEIAMLRECLAVMKAMKLEVVDVPATPARALAFATNLPLWISKPIVARVAGGGRGNKMPSFHIDLHSGRGKSEVEYLNGAVVREGKRLGIPTPVNELLTNTLLALTRKEIPLDEFANQPEKLLEKLKTPSS